MRYQTLATDYDGTIAHDGVVDDGTVDALHRARAGGLRLLMVTGRELHDLFATFKHWRVFERIVAENGALLFDPATEQSRAIAPAPPPQFIERLQKANVPLSVGRSIVATVEPHEHVVLQAIHDLGLEWHIIFNKGSVMALPSGVNKATGLKAVLEDLLVPAESVVAVGDTENDLAFLQMCGFPVAVANALPSVKNAAKLTTAGARGPGVTELINRLLADDPIFQ
ncbi:MAG: HAD family phosphatase [Phycisphaerae bacterium]|nr:HAD family phosphatase [Phycisphaerae bacterium]